MVLETREERNVLHRAGVDGKRIEEAYNLTNGRKVVRVNLLNEEMMSP